jgi:hypothetical protein
VKLIQINFHKVSGRPSVFVLKDSS